MLIEPGGRETGLGGTGAGARLGLCCDGEATGVLVGEFTGVLFGEVTGLLKGDVTGVLTGVLTGVFSAEPKITQYCQFIDYLIFTLHYVSKKIPLTSNSRLSPWWGNRLGMKVSFII